MESCRVSLLVSSWDRAIIQRARIAEVRRGGRARDTRSSHLGLFQPFLGSGFEILGVEIDRLLSS